MPARISFVVRSFKRFDVNDIVETRQFKNWIGTSPGFKIIEFTQNGTEIQIVLEKSPNLA